MAQMGAGFTQFTSNLTSVFCFIRKEHLHSLILPDGIQDDVPFLVEEEEHGNGDVICVLAIPSHLEERGCVTAAALVVI